MGQNAPLASWQVTEERVVNVPDGCVAIQFYLARLKK